MITHLTNAELLKRLDDAREAITRLENDNSLSCEEREFALADEYMLLNDLEAEWRYRGSKFTR